MTDYSAKGAVVDTLVLLLKAAYNAGADPEPKRKAEWGYGFALVAAASNDCSLQDVRKATIAYLGANPHVSGPQADFVRERMVTILNAVEEELEKNPDA